MCGLEWRPKEGAHLSWVPYTGEPKGRDLPVKYFMAPPPVLDGLCFKCSRLVIWWFDFFGFMVHVTFLKLYLRCCSLVLVADI